MKATLTFVGRYTTKKDGTPLVGGNGRPYTSLRIKTQEHGDKFLSSFDGPETKEWKVGDTVDIEVEQKGDFLNFSYPKKPRGGAGISPEQFAKIDQKLDIIITELKMIRGGAKVAQPVAQPKPAVEERNPFEMEDPAVEGFAPEDIPF